MPTNGGDAAPPRRPRGSRAEPPNQPATITTGRGSTRTTATIRAAAAVADAATVADASGRAREARGRRRAPGDVGTATRDRPGRHHGRLVRFVARRRLHPPRREQLPRRQRRRVRRSAPRSPVRHTPRRPHHGDDRSRPSRSRDGRGHHDDQRRGSDARAAPHRFQHAHGELSRAQAHARDRAVPPRAVRNSRAARSTSSRRSATASAR